VNISPHHATSTSGNIEYHTHRRNLVSYPTDALSSCYGTRRSYKHQAINHDSQRGKDMERLTPGGRPGRAGSDSYWVKSSLSFSNGNCVEVASLRGGEIGVRDSKDSAGPVLRFTSDEWDAFVGGVRNGEFDSFG
jgi:hypothetical protein